MEIWLESALVIYSPKKLSEIFFLLSIFLSEIAGRYVNAGTLVIN